VPAVEGGAATVRPLWVHEIKHDGYRLMVRRDGRPPPMQFARYANPATALCSGSISDLAENGFVR
jgi:hypothetical protein